jgi:hypothetical protein
MCFFITVKYLATYASTASGGLGGPPLQIIQKGWEVEPGCVHVVEQGHAGYHWTHG